MILSSCRLLRASSRKANGQSQDFIHILSEMRILTETRAVCEVERERERNLKNFYGGRTKRQSRRRRWCVVECGVGLSVDSLAGERRRKIFTFQSTKKTLELDSVPRWLHSSYFLYFVDRKCMHNSVRRISRHFVEIFHENYCFSRAPGIATPTRSWAMDLADVSVGFASDTQSRDLWNIIINSYCVCPLLLRWKCGTLFYILNTHIANVESRWCAC